MDTYYMRNLLLLLVVNLNLKEKQNTLVKEPLEFIRYANESLCPLINFKIKCSSLKAIHLLILAFHILLVMPIINIDFNKIKNRINSLLKVQFFSAWLEDKGENYSKKALWFFSLYWRTEWSLKILLNPAWLKNIQ